MSSYIFTGRSMWRKRTVQRGVSLIEALISLFIASFGMLGLVGMHLKLNENADVAKQRSEAVRLAQADMENLRVYRTTGVASTDTRLWTNLITNLSNSQVTTGTAGNAYASNTIYYLTRSITTSTVSALKEIQVRVAWADRNSADQTSAGVNQSVVLRSIVPGIDPTVAMSLSIAPNGSPVRDTLGRDVQIPIPAKSLGDGTSAFKPLSTSGIAYVFDENTGVITKQCTVAASKQNAGLVLADLTCSTTNAYLLSGFIRYKAGSFNNQFNPAAANDPVPSGTIWNVGMTMNDAQISGSNQGLFSLLVSTSPQWNGSISQAGYVAPDCSTESLKTVSFTAAVNYSQVNNGSTTTTTSTKVYVTVPYSLVVTSASLAPYTAYASSAISAIVDEGEYYVGYSCIIQPIDLDGTTLLPKPETPAAWTGLAKLGVTGATIATGSGSSYKVCRFSADYNLSCKKDVNGNCIAPSYPIWGPDITPVAGAAAGSSVTAIDNQEHPYAYLNVQKSLSNQNFLVIGGDKSCPNGNSVEVNGTGSETYTDTKTVQHQPP